ncbi:MAG: bifunctional 3-(3-hydroxy-phenyl)propionate/3-hydroxycinnamic acid hydroxylase [Chloroflexota bacterium]
MTQLYDVAVVGFGPVGATLANLLGVYGCKTVVLEQDLDIFPIPRAVHADAETLRVFQFAGLQEAIQPALGIYRKREYFNAKGEIFFEALVREEKPFGHPEDIYFHQPTLEAGLRDGVTRFDHVDVCLSVEVQQVEQDDAEVRLQVQDIANQTTQTIRAKYVIGCDGARSLIRKQLNLELRDLGFDQPWLVVDVYLKPGITPEVANIPNCHRQYCNPRQPITFVPTAVKGHYRWEFMQRHQQPTEQVESAENVRNLLSLVVDPDHVDVVRSVVYTFHALVAKQWRDRRGFIAGDAAHQMPPFAGQGMCSGIRDVHNLSWKLALVLSGIASASLLDTYDQERIPHVTRMTRGTMLLGNLIQTKNPVRALIRDVLFKTILRIPKVFGKLAHFTLRSPNLKQGVLGGEFPDIAGTLFAQPPIQTEKQETVLLDEVLGTHIAILGFQQNPDVWRNIIHSKSETAIPLTLIQVADNDSRDTTPTPGVTYIYDISGVLKSWFQNSGADFVIVRPDRYVFGAYASSGIVKAVDELQVKLVVGK